MNDKDWEKFFELIDKIVAVPKGFTWRDRRDEVEGNADEFNSEGNFSEFLDWFGGEFNK